MPRIPTPTSQISPLIGRPGRSMVDVRASSDAFGGQIGAAMQNLGGGLEDVARGFDAMQTEVEKERDRIEAQRRGETVANAMARADFTARELAIRNEVGPDAAGYQSRVTDEYLEFVDEQSALIEDDEARSDFRTRMLMRAPSVSARSATYEFAADAAYSELQANTSLDTLTNRIMNDPDGYEDLVANGSEIIGLRGDITAAARAGMQREWEQRSAAARFTGMLESATTVEDINAVQLELQDDEWASKLAPSALQTLTNQAQAAAKSVQTVMDAQARTALDSIEERAKNFTVLIPEDEMAAVQRAVNQSGNPVTIARMARFVADQKLVREYRTATPSEMRAGAMPLSTDGLNPTDRSNLADAGRQYGLSLEFMARTAATGGAPVEFVGAASGTGRPNERVSRVISAAVQDVLGPGAKVQVTSGHRPNDKGSQHSTGGAADFAIYRPDGSRVSWNDPDAKAIAMAAAGYGALGFGAGPNYMGGNHFHFDMGTGGALAGARAGVTVWSDDDGTPSDRGPGAVDWLTDLQGAGRTPQSPRIELDPAFIERALGTPGVKDRLGGSEDPAQIVAAYAAVSRDSMKTVLRREPSDEELYMAHKIGIGNATQLILGQADGNPDAVAQYRDLVTDYASAGPRGGTTAAVYGRQETLNSMADTVQTALNNDPITHADMSGVFAMNDLFGENGFSERGELASQVASYYNIPVEDMKPFTEAELPQIAKQFREASADDVVDMLATIESMGSDMARAAYAQLDTVNDVYAYAGGLNAATGQTSVSSDIVRGQKRIEENPDIVQSVGANDTDLNNAFVNATGGSLFDVEPSQRQAIANAALAHYIETQVARGRAGRFDAGAYEQSVQAVLGGTGNAPAVDDVNGAAVVMPPGVTGDQIEAAFERMTVADWANMSEKGTPPLYATGDIADPNDLAGEATLRTIGGGRYRVMLGDGSFLITGNATASGRYEAFILVPTKDRLQGVMARSDTPKTTPGVPNDVATAQETGLTHEQYRALVRKYGADAIDEMLNNAVVPE